MNLTILKPCQARTEDEIGGTLDVAVVEGDARACSACIYGVLISQESAVLYQNMVAFDVESHCLSQFGGIVLDSDILQRDIVALHLEGVSAEGAHLLAFGCCLGVKTADRHQDVGVVIPGDDSLVTVFTADGDVGEPGWDDELLLVNSLLYIDYLGVVHEGAAHFDGLVDGAEFAGTITGYYNRVGVVILVGCCQRQQGQHH